MKHFISAILLSLRYKWTIVGAVLCSLFVALLWGASLTTVFPVVKIVLEDKTAHEWVAAEIQESEKKRVQLLAEIKQLDTEKLAAPADKNLEFESKLNSKQDRLEAEEKALTRYQGLQPYITKYAPKSAFNTLVVAMVWLLSVTILKGTLLVLSTLLVARISNRTVMDMRRIYYRKALELLSLIHI